MTCSTGTLDTFLDLDAVPAAPPGYVVIHPLHDAPEAKRSLDGLGPLRLTPVCRTALVAVRCYLAAIMLLGAWRVVSLLSNLRQ